MYTTREKLGHHNRMKAGSAHIEADFALLKRLNQSHELIKNGIKNSDKFGNDLLYALLDHATACDIKDYRREYAKSAQKKSDTIAFIIAFKEATERTIEKYGKDAVFESVKQIEEVLTDLGYPIPDKTVENYIPLENLIGLNIRILCPHTNLFDLDDLESTDYLTKEELSKDLGKILSIILTATITSIENNKVDEHQTAHKVLLNESQPADLEQKNQELDEKADELEDKESELDERESELDSKESELEEKENELDLKAIELEQKQAETEKKSVPKKKNTQK